MTNPKVPDISGQKFHRWTVMERAGSIGRAAAWRCQCDCGTVKVITGNNLRSGQSKSCGCFLAESSRKRNMKHGMHKSSEYYIWQGILSRCNNISDSGYALYGATGINVCERWKESFINFIEDMGPKPSPEHSLDRINPFGNYEPSNCRWATRTIQSRNRRPRTSSISKVNGVYWSKQRKKWQASIGVNYKTINLGFFENVDDAIKARKDAESLYWEETS